MSTQTLEKPQYKTRKPSKTLEYVVTYTILTVFSAMIIAPILILVSASFKPSSEIFEYPPRFFPSTWTLENYAGALEKAPLLRYLLNTLLVALGVTFGQLVTSSLAAFAFARLNLPARNALFMGVIATYMVPWELTLIPNYLTVSNFKLIDNYGALVLPFLAGAFGIFLLRQNFKQIPEEFFDAAKIDGASNLQQLWYVVFPLARPALAALALLTFLNTWNQYLWPLIVTNSETWRTAQVGLRFFLVDQEGTNYGFVAAGAVIVLLPTLIAFVVLERSFVRGLSMGGLKG
jgi:sn-glycerol 3-phosphate transport system permease protein